MSKRIFYALLVASIFIISADLWQLQAGVHKRHVNFDIPMPCVSGFNYASIALQYDPLNADAEIDGDAYLFCSNSIRFIRNDCQPVLFHMWVGFLVDPGNGIYETVVDTGDLLMPKPACGAFNIHPYVYQHLAAWGDGHYKVRWEGYWGINDPMYPDYIRGNQIWSFIQEYNVSM